MTLSTHVLDVARGTPAGALDVALYRCTGGVREEIARSRTNADGRIASPLGGDLAPADYELVFDAGEYFARTKTRSWYTKIPVCFTVSGEGNYHVPLLLSPFAYSTYRGSSAAWANYDFEALNAAQPPKREMSSKPRCSMSSRG